MCDPGNKGSYRVMEKNGMQYEGGFRENVKIRGKYRDSLQFAILEKEWTGAN